MTFDRFQKPLSISSYAYVCRLASEQLRGRRHKDGTPLMHHSLAVADALACEGGVEDLDQLASAVSHLACQTNSRFLPDLQLLFGKSAISTAVELSGVRTCAEPGRFHLIVLGELEFCTQRAQAFLLAEMLTTLRELQDGPLEGWRHKYKLNYADEAARFALACQTANPSLCSSLLATLVSMFPARFPEAEYQLRTEEAESNVQAAALLARLGQAAAGH